MPAHAEILKSRSKKNPFKVQYIGSNGEPIATSELLSSRANCKKNICAINKMVDSDLLENSTAYILVKDFTDKSKRPFREYMLYWDGSEKQF